MKTLHQLATSISDEKVFLTKNHYFLNRSRTRSLIWNQKVGKYEIILTLFFHHEGGHYHFRPQAVFGEVPQAEVNQACEPSPLERSLEGREHDIPKHIKVPRSHPKVYPNLIKRIHTKLSAEGAK